DCVVDAAELGGVRHAARGEDARRAVGLRVWRAGRHAGERSDGHGNDHAATPELAEIHGRVPSGATARGNESSIVWRDWRPNRRYRSGTTKRLSRVDVTMPPRMTTAIGCSISFPGTLPAHTSGTSPRLAQRLVIRIGDSRSFAPRKTRPMPNGSPSTCSRCR